MSQTVATQVWPTQIEGGDLEQNTLLNIFQANTIATRDPLATDDFTGKWVPGSPWINITLNRAWLCISNATGAAIWAYIGAAFGSGAYNPNASVTQFGLGTALIPASGLINRQVPGVTGAVQPGATAADNVVAVYSLPANSFDVALRAIKIVAAGNYSNTGNNVTAKLFFNPSAAVVGSTITGGTLLATTGVVVAATGAWWLGGRVYKRGAAGANTQTCVSDGAFALTAAKGLSAATDTTATENAPILIAVTINAATATTDGGLVSFEVAAAD